MRASHPVLAVPELPLEKARCARNLFDEPDGTRGAPPRMCGGKWPGRDQRSDRCDRNHPAWQTRNGEPPEIANNISTYKTK